MMRRGGQARSAALRVEHGGASGNWLVQLLVVLAVVGLVGYEALAIVVTTASLDETARQVARAAQDEYRAERSLARASAAAEEIAALRDAELSAIDEDGDELVISLERTASTLLVHRIGPLEDLATVETTIRVTTRS